jgi:hypothetical protein
MSRSGLIARTRGLLDVRTLRTIFGRQHRPPRDRKNGDQVQSIVQQPEYDLTAFKLVSGKLALKLYNKGGRLLRIEVVVNNVTELRCGKRLEKLPLMLHHLERIVVDFLAAVQAAHDLRKLRGKQVVERVERTRRYRIHPSGVRVLAGLLILREYVLKPVLSGAHRPRRGRPPKTAAPLDVHYQRLQNEILQTLRTLKLAA